MKKINKKKGIKLIIFVILLAVLAFGGYYGYKFFIKKESPALSEKLPFVKPDVKIVNEKSNTRPIAVMYNNLNEARQVQSGISRSYMVYEIIVEGGITRLMALFKDAPEDTVIGSIRSSRHYYLDYALENDAVYVHWGWSPQAQSDIKTLKVNNIQGGTSYFYRWNPLNLATEHTGFTTMKSLNEAVNHYKYRSTTEEKTLLKYDSKSVDYSDYENFDVNSFTLKYSNYLTDKYVYDESTKVYQRFVNGKVHRDYKYDVDINAKNIIIYQVENHDIPNGGKGRQTIENIGSGKGYLVTEGKAITIFWEKSDRKSKTKYCLENYCSKNGKELVVNDGLTFMQIVPKSGTITFDKVEDLTNE